MILSSFRTYKRLLVLCAFGFALIILGKSLPLWLSGVPMSSESASNLRGEGIVESMPSKQAHFKSPKQITELVVSLEEDDAEQHILNMSLKYRGDQSIDIYESSLPWKHSYSMTLLLVETNATSTVLRQPQYPDDPSPSVVQIKPNQVAAGQVDLNERCPGLKKALENRDVIVFWSYQLKPVGEKPLNRIGGWLIIPRKDQK